MTATVLFRLAAAVLVLFAGGHTFGFLRFRPATAEGRAVHEGMTGVRFAVGRRSYTYWSFHKGFGLYVTVYLVFSAFLAWHLGGLAASDPAAIGALGWAFFAVQVAGVVLSWMYFFPITAVFSLVVAACTGWAAWLVG